MTSRSYLKFAAVSICDIILGSQHIRYTKTRLDTISQCIAKFFLDIIAQYC